MPCRHAHWFVGLTLLVIIVGFWSSYFTQFTTVPLAFHLHAISSTVWVALLLVQIYAIRSRNNALHKFLGKASLAFFPFLILGFVAIINMTAWRLTNESGPVIGFAAPSFGVGMAAAIVMYLVVFYLALKNRRTIALHAGYMLMTPAILFESPFSRILLEHMPFVILSWSEFPQAILASISVSMGLVVVFLLVVYVFNRRDGMPFLLTAIMISIQALLMYFAPSLAFLRSAFEAYASVPDWLTLAAGLIAGGAVSWLGWRHGGDAKPTPAPSVAPAE